MSIPLPYVDQYECRNETVEVYASDRRGTVEYQFNNYGYRNNTDYIDNQSGVGVYIGSSITSGVGVNWPDCFAPLSAAELNVPCYHFSQGCVPIDNQEMLKTLQHLKQSDLKPKYYVIQFIDLHRRYIPKIGRFEPETDKSKNIKLFEDTFNAVDQLLRDDIWVFLGCDSAQHDIPEYILGHQALLAWNPRFLDLAGVGNHPGPKWHKMIGLGLVKKISKSLITV